MRILSIVFSAAFLLFLSCGSDNEDNGGGPAPTAAALIAPVNNSECLSGISVSPTVSTVTFEWNPTQNTEKYLLYVKNLETNSELQYNAATAVTFDVDLQKGVPYSWYVLSKSADGTGTPSEKWKFYNAGDGVENYAPFPAEAIFPAMSSTIEANSVSLQWAAQDLDDDIKDYKVYMDSSQDPTTLKGTVTSPTINVAVNTGLTFYWKVITTDDAGNSSSSPVFQFKVN